MRWRQLSGHLLFFLIAIPSLSATGTTMENAEQVTARFSQAYCSTENLVDIRLGSRFGETIISVTVPTETERKAVSSLLPDEYEGVRVYLSTVFGVGSFTSRMPEYQEIQQQMMVSPYNVYGTPENQEIEKRLEKLYEKEQMMWSAMNRTERRAEIETAIKLRAEQGLDDFGNCWPRSNDDA